MSGMSKMIIIGNLGADPEIRYSHNGLAMANLRVAVTERRKYDNEYGNHTEWFSLICFGKTAENAQKFLKKGRQVFAEGRFQARKWIDRENKERTVYEVVVTQLLFLGNGRDEFVESNPSPSNSSIPSESHERDDYELGHDYLNDDTPF